MKGIIVEKDGTIHLADDIPMPEPGPYEALVKIESCRKDTKKVSNG